MFCTAKCYCSVMGILATVILESHLREAQKVVPLEEAERKGETSISKVIEVEISFLMKINAFHLISLVVYTDLENCKTTSPPALETK